MERSSQPPCADAHHRAHDAHHAIRSGRDCRRARRAPRLRSASCSWPSSAAALIDHAVGAVAALRHLLLDEGGLQRMRLAGRYRALRAWSRPCPATSGDRGQAGARRASPSMSTVQAPHWPRPQPNLVAVRPSAAQHVEQRLVGIVRTRRTARVRSRADRILPYAPPPSGPSAEGNGSLTSNDCSFKEHAAPCAKGPRTIA